MAHSPGLAIGFETGLAAEAQHTHGSEPAAIPACFSAVAATGSAQGSYMLQIDYSSTSGALTRTIPMGSASAGCVGFWIEFVTNGATVDNHLIACDNGSLDGWLLQRRVSDQKLEISDFSSVLLTSASAYTSGWHYIQVRWEMGAVHLRIYDNTLTLAEDLSALSSARPGVTLRIGQLSGTPTAGKYNLDNIYLIRGGSMWGPLNPTFEAHSVNAGPPGVTAFSPTVTLTNNITNSATSFVYTSTGDPITTSDYIQIDSEVMDVTGVDTGTNTLTVARGFNSVRATHTAGASIINVPPENATNIVNTSGTDDVTTEWDELNEIPAGTTDYVVKTDSGLTAAAQYYGHAGFGLGTPAFIAVAVSNYWEKVSASGIISVQDRVKLSTSAHVTADLPLADAAYKAFTHGIWYNDPAGSPWTAANVDSALPGHGMRQFGVTNSIRCHQILMYVIYGDDAVAVDTSLGTLGVQVG